MQHIRFKNIGLLVQSGCSPSSTKELNDSAAQTISKASRVLVLRYICHLTQRLQQHVHWWPRPTIRQWPWQERLILQLSRSQCQGLEPPAPVTRTVWCRWDRSGIARADRGRRILSSPRSSLKAGFASPRRRPWETWGHLLWFLCSSNLKQRQ